MITADNASYVYTGVQAQYKLGKVNFNPSFTPGFYHEGDGKDLGHVIEFKTEIQISYEFSSCALLHSLLLLWLLYCQNLTGIHNR